MTEFQISTPMFFRLLTDQYERERAGEGVACLILQYYADYSGASSLDPEFIRALKAVTNDSQYIEPVLEEIVFETEQGLREGGRQVSTLEDPDGIL